MKFALILSFIFSSITLSAQTTNVEIPEFIDIVMQVNSDGTLSSLDKTDIIIESKENLMRRFLIHLGLKAVHPKYHIQASHLINL